MHALQILEIASVLYQERIDTNVRSHDNSEVKVTTRENSRELKSYKRSPQFIHDPVRNDINRTHT